MAIKIERTCSRCGRENALTVASPAEAATEYELQAKKLENAKKIREFIGQFTVAELPAYVSVLGGFVTIHDNLCGGEDAKRSCEKRIGELANQASKLPPRAPRTKKDKAEGEAEKPTGT